MADKEALGYFVDDSGETVQIPLAQSHLASLSGYLPASPEQIADFEKVKKFSSTGQRAKTFGEGAGQALTFGGSTWAEKALGVNPEDIKAREEINPGEHLAGTLTGVALPLIATAGGAGVVEGGAAAAEAGAEGASGLLGAAKAVSSVSAPSLIARAGEGAAGALEGVLPEATTALGRIGTKAALGAASAGTEGALYGAGHVVHEAALGDPNLTWQSAAEEVGLSGLLGGGIGAAGGVLGGLTKEVAAGPVGKQVEEWLETAEARNNLGQAAGGQNIRSIIKKDVVNQGWDNVNQMAREGRELGFAKAFSTPQSNFDLAEEIQAARGEVMDATKAAVDSSPEGIAAQPSAASVASKARNDILSDLRKNFADSGVAEKFEKVLGDFEDKYGAAEPENKMTFSDLHDARQLLDKSIYGLKGDLTTNTNYKVALHDFRDLISKEITSGLEKVPGDAADAWGQANRDYQVASFFKKYAERGMLGQKGNNVFPISTWIPALAGLIHGGPLGAAAVGGASFLAKRYGPGALAGLSRGMRNLVDEGGAEALVNKTADLIASERRAAVGEAAAAGASGAGRLAKAFDIASEKLEPAVAPLKDATRDVAQEKVGQVERQASDAPETVAALSQLEKAKQSVDARVNALARSVVTGTAAPAGAHKIVEREDTHLPLDRIHQLANNPDLMQQQIAKATQDLELHAPGIAQAAAVHMSKSVSYLNAKFPPMPKMGPLGPVLKMPKSQIFQMHKTQSVINKPTLLLKHAANYQLTPDLVAAVQATAPERLAHMQQAVLQHVAELHTESVPYKSRLQIGILMGRDMDGSTTPQAIQAAQLTYALPSAKSPENQLGGGAKATQTGLGKLSLASNMRLPGQAAESRRREG